MQLSFDFSVQAPEFDVDKYINSFRACKQEKRFNFAASLANESRNRAIEVTAILNTEFENNQLELIVRFGISEDEIISARIEQKLLFKERLTYDEVVYANTHFWTPKGYHFNFYGLAVDTDYFRYFET